jgi:hypothetical protein
MDPEDRPWTEEQWEVFMRNADLRAARYSELLETLVDDPDRDDIIDREMGWDRNRDLGDSDWMAELEAAAADGQENDNLISEEDAASHDERMTIDEEIAEDERNMRKIPAYALCEALSHRLDKLLLPLMPKDAEADEDVIQAYIQIKIASAKILAGHGMGYRDEVIGGNVVNCKRALAAADECAAALASIAQRNLISTSDYTSMAADLTRARHAITDRLAELRSRMWWQ